MAQGCDTLVVHCMDYRLQFPLNEWLAVNLPANSYDRISIAGGVYDVFDVLRQVELASRLHEIGRVVLINHEDCGAYGLENSDARHEIDLRAAREKINRLFPQLNVDLIYQCLNGTFERID